jgi:hypothetical protein
MNKSSTWMALRNPAFRKFWLATVISGTRMAAHDNAPIWMMNIFMGSPKTPALNPSEKKCGKILKVEAEVAADYMGQAEGLLREGQPGQFDHVPAAVLAGAVLEKALRTLCNEQHPPVSIVNAKGEPRTLNSLIDELKKAEVFNELKAKQLRSWADIRNAAAHGHFIDFGKVDVAQMISGINNFLADYLK